MDSLRGRVEAWIREQRERMSVVWSPPPLPRFQWPWPPPWGKKQGDRKQRERIAREEFEQRRRQLQELCRAVKVESVADLQDVLCSMVLSECVYKKPADEMVRAINKFKADFGGQVVCLDRVQPSLDHVTHRYLIAESGDTLYASFIGTKQYKDIMTDANILQGAIFHDEDEDPFVNDESSGNDINLKSNAEDKVGKPLQSDGAFKRNRPKPAAHRGFLARAKGIPALELYRLAQRKNRKLVLCGHSLGGAVAALATLAILRLIASTQMKGNEKVPVKCITFSQPPVGNAALRDYVQKKGWQHIFKTYCIPEDLVPRILSPAYFHHYNEQPLQGAVGEKPAISSYTEIRERDNDSVRTKNVENEREKLVLGLGPVRTSFWRLSRLVPLEGVRQHLHWLTNTNKVSDATFSASISDESSGVEEPASQSLEIRESSIGISLSPLSVADNSLQGDKDSTFFAGGDTKKWHQVYLPTYVPFGQLYLLENSSVQFLSGTEYSKLTSVRSVISELRERFQSHSMKSYRSRFQKIYETFMCIPTSPFLGVEQPPAFPHLQHWLGLAASGHVELGHIVEAPVIQTAVSILPLGWNGLHGNKDARTFTVDILGHGLHLCTLIQAQINGRWCSTSVKVLPPDPPCCSNYEAPPELQKMRVLVGAPLKGPPKHASAADPLTVSFSTRQDFAPSEECGDGSLDRGQTTCDDSVNHFVIYCTTDFNTVSKEVYVRTRRIHFLGLEGAGKTSLLAAILGQKKTAKSSTTFQIVPHQEDAKEGVIGGLCYADSDGVNLQDLPGEVNQFRKKLELGMHDTRKKTDLVLLVHNLSHKIPRYHQSNTSPGPPALSILLDEAKALGIPCILAITNRYSVSAHQLQSLIDSVIDAYQTPPGMTAVVNSSPYVIPSVDSTERYLQISKPSNEDTPNRMASQSLVLAPVNFFRMPFKKKAAVMPVTGVESLCRLVNRVLESHEEASFQELTRERLYEEMLRNCTPTTNGGGSAPPDKGGYTAAAAVGASVGAGVGIVLAIVMGAASALRKP